MKRIRVKKNIQTTFELNFNQTIIKIIHPFLWSQTQHHRSNDVNKVHDRNSTQVQPENNYKIILHLIYTLKKGFKMKIRRKNINYIQINQEKFSNTI